MTNKIDYVSNRIHNKTSYEVKSSLSESFELVKKVLDYFPTRFILLSVFFSYILLADNSNFFRSVESHTMSIIFSFFQVHTITQSGYLYVVGKMIIFPTNTQIIFLIFFPTLAFAAKTSVSIRLKILGCGLLNFVSVIALQMVLIGILLFTKVPNLTDMFLHYDMILSTIVSAFVIEFTFFSVLTLPRHTKVKPVIRRNYITESFYYGITILLTVLIFQFLFQFLQINVNSIVGVFAALSILSMLSFSNYVGYVLGEMRVSEWMKILYRTKRSFNPNVTFLLAAYNEEEFIGRAITSIDKAAAKYSGKTTILVVDDGSTDNTANILSRAMSDLKHCTGSFITIPNSGKGGALNTGLAMTRDEIIFRMDADSVVAEHTIPYMIRHFTDPQVASVGGLILSLDERSVWQKLFDISSMVFSSFKKNGDVFDSMVIQAGAFSVFRKGALIRAGGWVENQNGEDGEMTVRLGRMGYKNEYDDIGIVFSDTPGTVNGLRKQRMRWAVAFFHSRSSNLNILKEFRGPRTASFALNLLGHAIGFMTILFWPFLLASAIAGNLGDPSAVFFGSHTPGQLDTPSSSVKGIEYLIRIPFSLIIVELAVWISHYIYIAYFLSKYNRLGFYKYVPLLRLYWFIAGTFPRLEALGILLSWSSRWKTYSKESYNHLLEDFNKSMRNFSS